MNTRDAGNKGESFACDFLRQQGFRILETNYRVKIGEIDIVARDGEMLVFVEVKMRDGQDWDPFEAVGPQKQRKLYRVAEQYLLERYKTLEVDGRFDVLAVHVMPDGTLEGDLLKNAFYK